MVSLKQENNEPNTSDEYSKQQGGSPLPFLDHDFKAYHITEWYQWELNVQMLAKGATQLNAANNMESKQHLEVNNFPKGAKE
eukprot:3872219-Ditylum_brightwellii.AAC.1